jgi:hypothetical protein
MKEESAPTKEQRNSNFVKLLRQVRSWDNFDFERYRVYLKIKAAWKAKMN